MATSRKRKTPARDGSRAPKARKTVKTEEKHAPTAGGVPVSVPTHQEVLECFLLADQDTSSIERLLQLCEQIDVRLPRSSRTSSQILRKIQDHFVASYNLRSLLDEVHKLNPHAPRFRSRWDAMNALAKWDLQAEQDIERARGLGRRDLGPLLTDTTRDAIQKRVREEFESLRLICQDRSYEEPHDLRHALDLIETPILNESIIAIGLPVPDSVDDARELLQKWDIASRKDLEALGLDPGLLGHESRAKTWDRIVKADQPLRARAIALGYDIHANTRAYEIARIMSTSIFATTEQELVETCRRAGLKTDTTPRELRRRLINHERVVLSMRYPEELRGADTPDGRTDLATSVDTPAVQAYPHTRFIPDPEETPVASGDSEDHQSESEPSPSSEYLQGLGEELPTIYQQMHPETIPNNHGTLVDAFAIAFFEDLNERTRVQEAMQKIFRLALAGPPRLSEGGWNYVRRVRHDWYRELDEQVVARGETRLWDQISLGPTVSVELLQLLADVYHVQVIAHIREDHRWHLIARGPSQLEGARTQIHLINWKDQEAWTAAKRVAPEHSWYSNFPNSPLCIMPIIPAPVFTDGIRPVPLLRDPTRNDEEDYQLEMNDLFPHPLDLGSQEHRGLGEIAIRPDDENDQRNVHVRDNEDPDSRMYQSQEARTTEMSMPEAGTNTQPGQQVWKRASREIEQDQLHTTKESLGSEDKGIQLDTHEDVSPENLQSSNDYQHSSQRHIQESAEAFVLKEATQQGRMGQQQQTRIEQLANDTETRAQEESDAYSIDTVEKTHPGESRDRTTEPILESPLLPLQPSTSSHQNHLRSAGSRIPGLGLLDSSRDTPETKFSPSRQQHPVADPEPSESELFAGIETGQAPLVEKDSRHNSNEGRSNSPGIKPQDSSIPEKRRAADQTPPEKGVVYFQGKRIALYDEDSPGSNEDENQGNSLEIDDKVDTPSALADSIGDDSRSSYAQDLDDPIDDWQHRSARANRPTRHPPSPLHWGDEDVVDTLDPEERDAGKREEYASETGYDSLFDE